jgi:hypothetical protein
MLPTEIGYFARVGHPMAFPLIISAFFLCLTAPFFSDEVWWRKLLLCLLSLLSLAFAKGAVVFLYVIVVGVE